MLEIRGMKYSPRNITVACDHKGLTHFGGVYFFHEFLRVLQLRHFLARQLRYRRQNHRYSVSQMILALVYPLVLGLDRLETASFLRSNGTFQYLTGLPSFPDPQTLRRFLLHAPDSFWEQMHRVNDRLLQTFIHLPGRRSRLIFDLDSTVVTVFGKQEDAAFGFDPVFVALEARPAQYAVVARLTQAFKRLLPGLTYQAVNRNWEMAEFEHRLHGWPKARRFVVARRFIQAEEAETTLFAMGRYIYRAWVTNLSLTPAGIWHFYDGRAAIETRIRELREDFALRKIPTKSFAANALYLEIVRLAYNLVTAFQRSCLEESWQSLTLQKLRYKLFLIPGELTRPQNRPVLRLRPSPMLEDLSVKILVKVTGLRPIGS